MTPCISEWTRPQPFGRSITLAVLASLLYITGLARVATAMTSPADDAARARISSSYGDLPLSFELNRGQTDNQVRYLARGQGYSLFLAPRQAVLSLRAPGTGPSGVVGGKAAGDSAHAQVSGREAVVRMRLANANSNPILSGLDPIAGKSNYFIGNDPEKWQSDVPHYARVKYHSVYPGIDLVYYGKQRQIEYDFVVAAGVDPRRIELVFDGTRRLSLDNEGNLILATAGGHLMQHKPVVYQERDGVRASVEGRYVLRGGNRAGFRVGRYDASRPLVIDPVLSYSTYLGGSGKDFSFGIAVDSAGNAYIPGFTASTNFPTSAGGYQRLPGTSDSGDAFVTKLNATGTALVYSTYLGGGDIDIATSIAVDSSGNAYFTGYTASTNFPVSAGAYQVASRGGAPGETPFDAFVAKLNPTGNALVYSTLIGGNRQDYGASIAVDAGGIVYVAGVTGSSNFPTTAGAFQTVYGGGTYDAFVLKLNATGTGLAYSTLLGGNGWESGFGIAIDGSGNAYISGRTASANFPTTAGAFQRTYGGGTFDAFATKLNTTGTGLVYSTFLGGDAQDYGGRIALDAAGNAYVTGNTGSSNFPTTPGAYQRVYGGGASDAFVTKFNATGSGLVYSTYVGGRYEDEGHGIVVDVTGNAYVAGYTGSDNFATTADAHQTVFGGAIEDAFVIKLNPSGSTLLYSTLLGGSGEDEGFGIALDSNGNVYMSGYSSSPNFPVTPGAFRTAYGGGQFDSIVAKFKGLGMPQTVLPTVVEFYNASLDNFFITADPNEQAAVNNGAAGPGWVMTGNNFIAGGPSKVCRFYGSLSPGPNSHFYTIDPAECQSLKNIQATTPATQKRWNFESNDFSSSIAANGQCGSGLIPVYRAYNNGFARAVDSNHRITANLAAYQAQLAKGWLAEGVVMCAPQ